MELIDAVYDDNLMNARLASIFKGVGDKVTVIFQCDGIEYGSVACFDMDMARRVAGEWVFVSECDRHD